MVGRRLVVHVAVRDPATQDIGSFGPGDVVPDWAAALITNPDVWAEVEVPRRRKPAGKVST